MKKLLVAAIISLSSISTAALAEIKVGIILGFTGPIESLTPAMRDGAKLAFLEPCLVVKLSQYLKLTQLVLTLLLRRLLQNN